MPWQLNARSPSTWPEAPRYGCGWASTPGAVRRRRGLPGSTSSRAASAPRATAVRSSLGDDRARLGSAPGVSIVDLGQQNLKDVQHERIYQLALDGGPEGFPPLKTEAPKSGPDALAERIERHVEEMIEQSLKPRKGRPKARSTLRYTVIGLIELLLLVLTILLIVWLARRIL